MCILDFQISKKTITTTTTTAVAAAAVVCFHKLGRDMTDYLTSEKRASRIIGENNGLLSAKINWQRENFADAVF